MNNPRGRPFEPGNNYGRGRPKGSRNKATFEAQQLLEQYSAALVRKCITQALQGDVQAMRLCMDRLMAVRRDMPLRLKLPAVATMGAVGEAEQLVIRAISSGRIAPGEGEILVNVLGSRRRSIETDELITRVEKLRIAELAKVADAPVLTIEYLDQLLSESDSDDEPESGERDNLPLPGS